MVGWLMAEMVPVDSDAIEEVGFDAGELVVKYRNGGTYVYYVVPEWSSPVPPDRVGLSGKSVDDLVG
jgi:hypothetical protein